MLITCITLRSASYSRGHTCHDGCDRNKLWHVQGKSDESGIDLIVECNFRENFTIPCTTPRYVKLLSCVPEVFVGTVEWLLPIVQAVATEMNLAFASHNLTKPPWRNAQSMMSKWAPQRSKDWLPLSSPTSAAQSPGADSDYGRRSYTSDMTPWGLSNKPPIAVSSLRAVSGLSRSSLDRTTHQAPSSHDVLVGFSKSSLSTVSGSTRS